MPVMSTFIETQHPRATDGTFAEKPFTAPEAELEPYLGDDLNDVFIQAEEAADGTADVATVSLLSAQGTAIPEATLCTDCAEDEAISSMERTTTNDAPPRWGVSTGNELVSCVHCGRGAGSAAEARLDSLREGIEGDIAGYTYKAENFTPTALVEHLITEGRLAPGARGMTAEEALNQLAGIEGVEREDEYTFDSDDFPKTITAGQLTVDDLDWLE